MYTQVLLDHRQQSLQGGASTSLKYRKKVMSLGPQGMSRWPGMKSWCVT